MSGAVLAEMLEKMRVRPEPESPRVAVLHHISRRDGWACRDSDDARTVLSKKLLGPQRVLKRKLRDPCPITETQLKNEGAITTPP